jgi:hypothetical protein
MRINCIILTICLLMSRSFVCNAGILEDAFSDPSSIDWEDRFGCDEVDMSGINPVSWIDAIKETISTGKAYNNRASVCTVNAMAMLTPVGAAVLVFQMIYGAEDKAYEYKICLDSQEEGHPIAYTDGQIGYILQEQGKQATIEAIADKYDKMCLKKDGGGYHWHEEGSCFDGICIAHAKQYAYLLCASVISACPCIKNIQRGNLNEPKYETDDDGVLKINDDGSPIIENEDELKRYARHCRMKRLPPSLFEQPEDLPTIFDSSCFDMKGSSKRNANLTAGFVQCLEGTARNIFEKNILGTQIKSKSEDAGELYVNDIKAAESYLSGLKEALEGKTAQDQVSLRPDQLIKALKIIKEFLFEYKITKMATVCQQGGQYRIVKQTVSFKEKYTDFEKNTSPVCCESNGTTAYNACFINAVGRIPSITETTESITAQEAFQAVIDIENMINDQENGIKAKHAKYLAAYQFTSGFTTDSTGHIVMKWSLFDIFRNNIKFFAVICIALWFFLFGFKVLMGEISLDVKKLQPMLLHIVLSYFIIFDNDIKNYIINMIVSVAKGIGMSLFDVMNFDKSSFEEKCNYADSKYSAAKFNDNAELVCEDEDETLICRRYRLNPDGSLSDKCVSGLCTKYRDFITRPNYEKPYKPYNMYNSKTGTFMIYKPYCRDPNNPESAIVATKLVYSAEINDMVYSCDDTATKGFVLDDGYTVETYIKLGLIEDSDEKIKLFKYVITDQDERDSFENGDNESFIAAIKSRPVVTATHRINALGAIERIEYTTSATGLASERYLRTMRVKYLESRRSFLNEKANYPVIIQSGIKRDMSYVGFFDKLDCKIVQYLTFQAVGKNAITSAAESVISGGSLVAIDNLVTGRGTSGAEDMGAMLLGGIIETVKFIFVAFPFGIFAMITSLLCGISLFLFVARAVQHYCISIFGIVVYLYISPVIFVLYLFEQTSGAMKQWQKSLQSYILGASIPFVSVSLFLTIINFAIFGYPDKYDSEGMFRSDGTIDPDCYKGNESSAPFACLAMKLSDMINVWKVLSQILLGPFGILAALIGSAIDGTAADVFKYSIYLVWKSIVAIVIIRAGSSIIEQFENAVTKLIGQSDTAIGMGFENKNPLNTIFNGTKSFASKIFSKKK